MFLFMVTIMMTRAGERVFLFFTCFELSPIGLMTKFNSLFWDQGKHKILFLLDLRLINCLIEDRGSLGP